MTTHNQDKKAFVVPTLTEYGKFEELTQGASRGLKLDNDFPNNTPLNDLTFS